VGERSAPIRDRVEAARERQRARYRHLGLYCNAELPGPLARREARIAAPAEELLAAAVDRHALTGRGFDRALKVARTIADLDGSDAIELDHVGGALAYRVADPERDLIGAG